MKVFTTEITSDIIASDNPIHQRLLMPYHFVKEYIHGDLIEPGCGEGRGIPVISSKINTYLGLDKNDTVIDNLKKKFPECRFLSMQFPPIANIENNSFDSCISFQVIEHIRDDQSFIKDIYRVLRPGGVAIITTPNRKMSLTRNPWHIREYLHDDLYKLVSRIFPEIEMLGITGNKRVMQYYEENKRSVRKITRYDILNLQYRLPASLLRIPYELMNRLNRNRLKDKNSGLVDNIIHSDYIITQNLEESLDLMCIMHKK